MVAVYLNYFGIPYASRDVVRKRLFLFVCLFVFSVIRQAIQLLTGR